MKHYIITGALLVIMLCGCSSASKQAAETEEGLPVINLSENVEQVSALHLSDAVDHVEVVPLETTDKSLIKQVSRIEVTENDIWVKNSNTNILRFSRDGKFRNTVGKVGQGPGEYSFVTDFVIDPVKKELHLNSSTMGILTYDYEGNFLRKATDKPLLEVYGTPDPAGSKMLLYKNQFLLSRNLYLLNMNNPNLKDSLWSVALMDEGFNFKKLFKNPAHAGREDEITSEEHLAPTWGWVNYWTEERTSTDFYGDELTLKLPDTDTIYIYNASLQELEPRYAIHTEERKGDYALTHEWVKERRAFGYFRLSHYYASRDFVYLVGHKDNDVYTYAYDIRNRSVRLLKRHEDFKETVEPFKSNFGRPYITLDRSFSLTNDIQGGKFLVKYRSQGKYWVDSWQPGFPEYDEAVEELRNSPDAPRKQELLNVIDRTDDEDNPILLIGVLK